ncbi:OmpA family protein [Roseimarinus sediminis]|uniref:OmpA family protein n=1 Tax=Roseimarinus sediminis TaxID=1610899 RepID=UPI003D236E11
MSRSRQSLRLSGLAVLLLLQFSLSAYADNVNRRKAEKQFDKALISYSQGDLEQAEQWVTKAIESDSTYPKAFLLLADIASEKGDQKLQTASLTSVTKQYPSKFPKAHKILGKLLYEQGLFQEALDQYSHLIQHGPDSIKVLREINQCRAAIEIMSDSMDVTIDLLDSAINTALDEYWPFVSADDATLYFTRLIRDEKPYAFERIYYAEKDGAGWKAAKRFMPDHTNEVNEGTFSMTADQRYLFFTVCGKSDAYGSCDIFYMYKDDTGWSAPLNAGRNVNTAMWDSQPSIAPNGAYLYWSSNREGGAGKRDIWYSKVYKQRNGQLVFAPAQNAGNRVNTSENDFSPFIHADGVSLYFASDGHFGLGRSDLFMAKQENGVFSEVSNLGYPINSIADDEALVVSPSGSLAFLSSNRVGSSARDLYQLELPETFLPRPAGYIKGLVIDASTKQPLDAEITLTRLDNGQSELIKAEADQGFLTTVAGSSQYALSINKKGYLFFSKHYEFADSIDFQKVQALTISLMPIGKGKSVVLENIFFEFDKAVLDKASETELNDVIHFMEMNPGVKVEIAGHTDNVGNDDYNQQLSEKRAAVIVEYLSKKIPTARLSSKGYGARFPLTDNDSEEARKRNRRSELTIVDY